MSTWTPERIEKTKQKTKKLSNMNVIEIPIVIGALGTVIKGLVQGLDDLKISGRVETIQTTALLRSDRILRRVWRFEETCCHSDSSEKPSGNAGVENSQKS